jgi:glyoxylase-like metal-dependent hydrolase (beta-lactamase superfamily II)
MVGPPPDSWKVPPERARAFELAPGVWQLRLPLPWPVIPHVNAYWLADERVLVDCGSAGHPSHRAALSAALAVAGATVEDVRTLVGTHTHSDHVGLAAWVIEASGCEFLMHPDTAHFYDGTREPERIEAARRRRARAEGVPEAQLDHYGDVAEEVDGVLAPVESTRPIHDGDTVGRWTIVETPGHAPSHIVLVDGGTIILGDLLAPVFAPWFDYGYSDDPVAEFLWSLDRIEALGPFELALPGHGRALEDLPAILAEHREGVAARLDATVAAVRDGVDTGHEISRRLFGDLDPTAMVWRLTETVAYLRHLRLTGAISRSEDADGYFHYELSTVRA